MKLKNMFKKTRRNDTALRGHDRQPEVPDGLLRKCNVCKEAIFTDEVPKEVQQTVENNMK